MKNNLMKLMWLVITGVFCLMLFVGILFVLFTKGAGLVLLYMPILSVFIAGIGAGIWYLKYKTGFETFLVFISYTCCLFSFVIFGPMVVERSLSSFIFFEAVENGIVDSNTIPDDYMHAFIQKRFDDGVTGGFLIQKSAHEYEPTLRSKLFYGIVYPLGVLTNTTRNYQVFKSAVHPENTLTPADINR